MRSNLDTEVDETLFHINILISTTHETHEYNAMSGANFNNIFVCTKFHHKEEIPCFKEYEQAFCTMSVISQCKVAAKF